MMPTATHNEQAHTPEGVLFVAFELREKTWKRGFTTGHGQKPHERTMAARDLNRLLDEGAQAKARCGLCETAPVVSCDEVGRAGFGLRRFLQTHGSTNPGVDSSSIAGNRRRRCVTRDRCNPEAVSKCGAPPSAPRW